MSSVSGTETSSRKEPSKGTWDFIRSERFFSSGFWIVIGGVLGWGLTTYIRFPAVEEKVNRIPQLEEKVATLGKIESKVDALPRIEPTTITLMQQRLAVLEADRVNKQMLDALNAQLTANLNSLIQKTDSASHEATEVATIINSWDNDLKDLKGKVSYLCEHDAKNEARLETLKGLEETLALMRERIAKLESK